MSSSTPNSSPAALNARDRHTAGHTMITGLPKPDALFERLMQARSLIQTLGFLPKEPSLVYQDPATNAVKSIPIGQQISIGRWSKEQDAERGSDLAFPDLGNMSRRHFEVTRDEGFHILKNFGKAGTQLNGGTESTSEHVLRAGDIIYAAGATFIYVRGHEE